jgi:hypothetical protein
MTIDVLRRFRRPSSGPTEFYQRPHTYTIPVGVNRVCLAPNGQHSPAITLLIQADLANAGIINIGDSNVSVRVGIQLDTGKAALFAPQLNPSNQPGTLGTGISSYLENVPYSPDAAVSKSLGTALGSSIPIRVIIDIADFFAIADKGDQLLRVFWVESVALPER